MPAKFRCYACAVLALFATTGSPMSAQAQLSFQRSQVISLVDLEASLDSGQEFELAVKADRPSSMAIEMTDAILSIGKYAAHIRLSDGPASTMLPARRIGPLQWETLVLNAPVRRLRVETSEEIGSMTVRKSYYLYDSDATTSGSVRSTGSVSCQDCPRTLDVAVALLVKIRDGRFKPSVAVGLSAIRVSTEGSRSRFWNRGDPDPSQAARYEGTEPAPTQSPTNSVFDNRVAVTSSAPTTQAGTNYVADNRVAVSNGAPPVQFGTNSVFDNRVAVTSSAPTTQAGTNYVADNRVAVSNGAPPVQFGTNSVFDNRVAVTSSAPTTQAGTNYVADNRVAVSSGVQPVRTGTNYVADNQVEATSGSPLIQGGANYVADGRAPVVSGAPAAQPGSIYIAGGRAAAANDPRLSTIASPNEVNYAASSLATVLGGAQSSSIGVNQVSKVEAGIPSTPKLGVGRGGDSVPIASGMEAVAPPLSSEAKPGTVTADSNVPSMASNPGRESAENRARRIMQYNAEALAYELEAIKQESVANRLQGLKDALDTTSAMVTGDVPGVVAGLTRQISTAFAILGYERTAGALSGAADGIALFGAGKGAVEAIGAARMLAPAVRNTGINFGNVLKTDARSLTSRPYQNLFAPFVDDLARKSGAFVSR